MAKSAARAQGGGLPAEAAVATRDMDELLAIRTPLSSRLARTHDTRTLYAVGPNGGGAVHDCRSLPAIPNGTRMVSRKRPSGEHQTMSRSCHGARDRVETAVHSVMGMIRSVVVACMLLIIWQDCFAATFKDEPMDNDPNSGIVVVEGDFGDADDTKLNIAIQKYTKGVVLFQSGGGNLVAGLSMGEAIRLKGFSTGVMSGSVCASSCALAWLGGVKRFLGPTAKLGFHAAYRVDGSVTRETGMGNALVGAYLTRIGLPLSAVAYITKASPEDMTWLTPDDAKKVGIDLSIFEDRQPKTTGSSSSAPAATRNAPAAGPVTAEPTSGPSFDCSRASRDDEKTICNDPVLANADSLIGRLFKSGKTEYPTTPGYTRRRLRLYGIYRESCHSDALCILSVQIMALKLFVNEVPYWIAEYKSKLFQNGAGKEWEPVLPTVLNQCVNTTIVDITDRFGSDLTPYLDSNGFDSGSAANFRNGGWVVSYSKEPVLLNSRRGDRVKMCLVSIPRNCPPGDNRGREYRIINVRTNESVTMADSQHMCGGA